MNYRISFDPEDQQLDVIHGYLVRSYWAEGIPREIVEKAVANSLCVGAYDDQAQVGFARVITDRATFAYLADVFVLEGHRGRGLAEQMLEALEDHPELQGLRRWALFTRDMQPLYAKLGWEAYPHPDRLMVRDIPDIYTR
ncbi:GNAT family N-acetyltransferase [Sphingomonas psychrotolerans]|uniref:GNAT family N-acetyltransferase n=1 Tax=Sphingomonas psychrotolerans TaxID=1327635 RepID=A0A2K8MGP1_9SPHN|nr:GNAT family N-acetyltransferase [Sphingomonas psychrotolerans]ATY33050.1 GNAT family N-acetyltransferase [Sphingomonas psychrotolerans]